MTTFKDYEYVRPNMDELKGKIRWHAVESSQQE